MQFKKLISMILCMSCLVVGCGESTQVNQSEKKQVVADTEETKDNVDNIAVRSEDPLSTIVAFHQASFNNDIEGATVFVSESLQNEVRQSINERLNAVDALQTELMDCVVESAQSVFYEVAADDDFVIDASYLYDDKDLQAEIEHLCKYVSTDMIIHEYPDSAEYISDEEAKVFVKLLVKSGGMSDSWINGLEDFIRGKVLKKFMEDSGFVKKALAKEYVKEIFIGYLQDEYEKFEKSEAVEMGSRTYYLCKSNDSWLITRIDREDVDAVIDPIDEEDEYYDEDLYYSEFDSDLLYDDEEVDYDDEEYEEADYYEDDYEQGEFIIPNSDSEYLLEDELYSLSAKELTYARNEIFARHGYVFNSDELNDYFVQQEWYEIDPDYDGSLSEIEEYNADYIKQFQKDNGLMYVPD